MEPPAKKNPKISFVMPAYNCADTMSESVESIFNGNFEDGDELIIVNDGSTDATKDVIRELKKRYPLIQEIDNSQNKGCPASRNIGIRLAKNPLIFNLDADDILVPDSVSGLKRALGENGAHIAVFGESRYFTKDPRRITHKCIYKSGILTLADFLAGPLSPAGNCLYTKKSWEKIGGYWEYGKGLHEYWGFFLKQLANGAHMVVVPDSYYLHRYTPHSLFRREFKNPETSSLMATKMISPFLDLLNGEDAAYIRSEEGSRTWFENFIKRPIRLKSGEKGITGKKVKLSKEHFLKRNVKRLLSLFTSKE